METSPECVSGSEGVLGGGKDQGWVGLRVSVQDVLYLQMWHGGRNFMRGEIIR